MGKSSKTTQTQSTQPDAWTQQARQSVWDAANNAAGANLLDPQAAAEMNSAAGTAGGYAQAGQQGVAALNGDPAALARYMNPYTSSVINSALDAFGRLSGQTAAGIDSQATAAGAFGGSRNAVAQGVAQGQLGSSAQQQIASLLSGGYLNAQDAALHAANLGLAGNNELAGLSQYQQNLYAQLKMQPYNVLKGALTGLPGGMTSRSTQSAPGNLWSSILGAGGLVAGGLLGGPVGAGVGAKLGSSIADPVGPIDPNAQQFASI